MKAFIDRVNKPHDIAPWHHDVMHEEDDAPLADVIDPPEGGESTSLAVSETRLPAVLDAETLIGKLSELGLL